MIRRIFFAATLVAVIALSAAALLTMNDEQRPEQAPEALDCLDCHRSSNVNTNEGAAASRSFCTSCHAEESDSRRRADGAVLKVVEEDFGASPHRFEACVECHTDVARSPHRTESGAQCTNCHSVHGEGTAHAPHLRVDCQACHNPSEFVRLDSADHRVKLSHVDAEGRPLALSDHRLNDVEDEKACLRCHQSGNSVGAPAAVLPAKSALCVVCHPSSLSVGHPLFGAALLVFIIGMALMVRFWLVGSVQGETRSTHRKISLASESVWQTIFSRDFFRLAKIFILDILLQRRILKESMQRWSMHSLIFLAIVARFLLSLGAGLLFAVHPDGDAAMALIDKNHPFTAFVYDLLGLFIVLGIGWACLQRFVFKPAHVTAEIEDNITLSLVGLLAIAGFFASAARILMTQLPAETAAYAFVSYPLSRLLNVAPFDWSAAYPYLWYFHAILGAAFVAYLPFGKLKHIFNVPLTYFLEAVAGVKRESRI